MRSGSEAAGPSCAPNRPGCIDVGAQRAKVRPRPHPKQGEASQRHRKKPDKTGKRDNEVLRPPGGRGIMLFPKRAEGAHGTEESGLVFGTPITGAHGGRALVRLAQLQERTTGTWRRAAACRGIDPAVFYADDDDPESLAAARKICAGCPVREACVEHAIAVREPDGVWGGLTARERRREQRRRQKTA